MSITFSAAKETVREIAGEPRIVYVNVYPDGFDSTPVIDPEMPQYGPAAPQNPLEVNMSNTNAIEVLKTLGLFDEEKEEYSGLIIDLLDFIARCDSILNTLATIPEFDAGTESRMESGNGCATVIHLGRSAGYFQFRISQLRELAVFAKANEAVVYYS